MEGHVSVAARYCGGEGSRGCRQFIEEALAELAPTWSDRKAIARRAGVSEHLTWRILLDLVAEGLVIVVQPSRRGSRGARAKLYRLKGKP